MATPLSTNLSATFLEEIIKYEFSVPRVCRKWGIQFSLVEARTEIWKFYFGRITYRLPSLGDKSSAMVAAICLVFPALVLGYKSFNVSMYHVPVPT